jgi:TPR repeat protein
MRLERLLAGAVVPALAVLLLAAAPARADSDLGPDKAEKTLSGLKYLCWTSSLCPLTEQNYRVLKKAVAGDRDGQYLWGLTLLTGDGVPSDRVAGMRWIVLAAQQGAPDAAMFLADKIRNGERIDLDEDKIAAALKKQADAGDVEAMRALGPMYIRGRGVPQNADTGLALLRHAVERGSNAAEHDLAELYLMGAPGVQENRPQALRWFAASSNHGNVDSMVTLGYLSMTTPMPDFTRLREEARTGLARPQVDNFKADLAAGYCWLLRAALLDAPEAQEKLSLMFSSGEHDDLGNVLKIDLVQADFWFRIAARNPYHDNSQIRGAIEPKMTTAQLNEAKSLFDSWHAINFQQMKATPVGFPANPPRPCPPMAPA